jgi:hypothetical protein
MDFYERALLNHILASQDPGHRHDVLLRLAQARSLQELQHAATGLLLVLHRHGRREPREIRRHHFLPQAVTTLYLNLFIAAQS